MNAITRYFRQYIAPKPESTSALAYRIQCEQEVLPFEMLGRSLSYNPYPPRFKEVFPTLDDPCGLLVQGFVFDELESIVAQAHAHKAQIIIIDMARDSSANPSGEGLECIGYLRHYTSALIVLKDCFINPYQILQAVVYGADGVVLDSSSRGHKALLELAFRLNCMSFCEIGTLKEIKQAVLAKTEGFFIDDSVYGEFATLLPKSKCICHYVATIAQKRTTTSADFLCVQASCASSGN